MSEQRAILPEEVQVIVDQAIDQTLTALGIKARTISPWISKHKASKLAGRKRVEAAIRMGILTAKVKEPGKLGSRCMVLQKDVEKLIKQPYL